MNSEPIHVLRHPNTQHLSSVLFFLRYADHKFTQAKQEISSEVDPNSRRHPDLRMECQARGVLYLPEHSRFQYLLNLPESENIGQGQ